MLRINPTPKKDPKYPLMYTRPGQLARLSKIAKHYDMTKVELLEQVLVALEADLNGKKSDEDKG